MKLFIQSAMIFFGTLMAAGLVALGEPAGAPLTATSDRQAASQERAGEPQRWTESAQAAPRERWAR